MTPKLSPGKLRRKMKFKRNKKQEPNPSYRPVQQVSLSCHAEGAALPHPDPTDPESIILGQNKRVCFEPPKMNRKTLRRFKRFVSKWCKKNLVPLSPDTDISIDHWLSLTNYPEWRKEELRQAWAMVEGQVEARHFIVNGFTKDETYPTYKHLRGINARTDVFKCAVGPIFKAIEQAVFANEWFIKKVPVPDRAKYILRRIYGEGNHYYATDHTSFEGHFSLEFMRVCEFAMYKYMTQHIQDAEHFNFLIENVLGGNNEVVSKFFSYHIRATRMTGEMCTSLGNGFSNLMLVLFVAKESGSEVIGVVEGDDSLFALSKHVRFKVELFKELGFNIKLEKHENLNTASFCGNVFHLDDLINIKDPVEVLLSFGWTTGRYKAAKDAKLKALLRSKSLSLLYEYSGCPILQSLALYGLRVTEGYRARVGMVNEYQREKLASQMKHMKEFGLPVRETPLATRQLMEDLYSVPVSMQLHIENYLDSLTELQPLDMRVLDNLFNDDQKHYWLTYVKAVDKTQNMDFPNILDNSEIVWNDSFFGLIDSSGTALH